MRKFKLFIIVGTLLFIHINMFAQAKRPKLMVMPEYDWCIEQGYYKDYDDQGERIKVPDYDKAFQTNSELRNAIATIQSIMADRGFPLEDMRRSGRSVSARNARRSARTRTSSENPIDVLLREAKPDIVLDLSWSVYKNGFKTNIAFILNGVDAYSDKAIAPVEGNEVESSASDINSLVRASVLNQMDDFCSKLDVHFQSILENGREITFSIEVEEDALADYLDTRFDGRPLNRIIRDWVADNTVNRNFSVTSSSEDYIDFDQVRISAYDNDGINALDAMTWSEGLVDMLELNYKLKTKTDEIGLWRFRGKCTGHFARKCTGHFARKCTGHSVESVPVLSMLKIFVQIYKNNYTNQIIFF